MHEITNQRISEIENKSIESVQSEEGLRKGLKINEQSLRDLWTISTVSINAFRHSYVKAKKNLDLRKLKRRIEATRCWEGHGKWKDKERFVEGYKITAR